MLGTGLPVSMYTKKTPIGMWRFNVPQRILNIFCKRQISIKLFYLYRRLQCTDNYIFKIKFVFFLYLLLSASWKENDLSLYISVIRRQWGTEQQYLLSRFLDVSILQLLIIDSIYDYHMLTLSSNSLHTRSRLPNISDIKTRKRQNMVGIDLIRKKRI
jgi:hypothetical protein